MHKVKTYNFTNLNIARIFLKEIKVKCNILINEEIINIYGIMPINQIIKKLYQEFPDKIIKISLSLENNIEAIFTAKKIGIKNIIYKGNDNYLKEIISINNND